jgi:hypothetical protein
MNTKEKLISKIIQQLDELKERYPGQVVILETPHGTVSCELGDALIYEGADGSIVIDTE